MGGNSFTNCSRNHHTEDPVSRSSLRGPQHVGTTAKEARTRHRPTRHATRQTEPFKSSEGSPPRDLALRSFLTRTCNTSGRTTTAVAATVAFLALICYCELPDDHAAVPREEAIDPPAPVQLEVERFDWSELVANPPPLYSPTVMGSHELLPMPSMADVNMEETESNALFLSLWSFDSCGSGLQGAGGAGSGQPASHEAGRKADVQALREPATRKLSGQ
ncbi:hypothetical protein EJB05_45843, partial [Eragrostis curvula]